MNKKLKKILSAALSLTMIAGSIVLPTVASAEEFTPIFEGDTVLKEWKFDFGAADSAPEEGYTLITPETSFVTNKVDGEQYGFLGIGEEDYKLTNRYDGWTTQQGQVIELAAGGGTGLNDAVGVVGAGGTDEEGKGGKGNDLFGNKGDKYYPTRFALKVEDDTYYRIRATVTTLDPEKDATVSLYTERKHPIYTEKTVTAGETVTTEFTVRVTPIYYEKSSPTGSIKDEMVTVGVLGENSALASVEIQQVETAPTVWVLGDSTVTDGNCELPFFPLQNYTGVGTGLTKYLRRDYAMVNEGEGGLNAADNNHFNMVKSRIKKGDYMYVEYGHNHKTDGPTGYKACLDKYYDACHAVGAKLIIVSPVQSINSWNETTSKWNDRFGGETNFAGVGKAYVAEKVAADATDIAFADLTKTSVAFVDRITENGGNVSSAAKFYYQTEKGGATDSSHPNDAGAENFAYCFFEAAKENDDETQKAVLADLLANMTDEQPNLVSAEIVAGGIGGSAWPQYIIPTTEKYPILIKDVVFNEDGTVKQVDVVKRDAEIKMAPYYGMIVITIYNADGTEKGKIYAQAQVDHSAGNGPQTVTEFTTDIKLEEGDTYEAVVLAAEDATEGLKIVEPNIQHSAVYKPTDIEKNLITNEDGDGNEDFDYFGATYGGESPSSLADYNGWTKRGSAGISLTLGEASIGKYVSIQSDGAKNGAANQGSFYVAKDFVKAVDEEGNETDVLTDIGTTGRYVVSMDAKYVSGGGLEARFVTGNSDKAAWGTESITLFTIGTDGAVTANGKEAGTVSATAFTNVQYILDMDLGKAYVTVGGGDEIEVDVPNYQTESLTVSPSKLTGFMFGGDKKAFAVDVANLTVGKLKDRELPEYTASVKAKTGNAETTITVNADKAYEKAALIAAEYTDGGVLENIEITPIDLAEGENTQTVAVTEGAKLMLWDSLQGMKPIAFTSETKPAAQRGTVYIDEAETLEKTSKINTVMTAKAEANDGFVFMGWLDENGNKVSDDAEYTFRLRGDKQLVANFVKEPGVEDITNYSITAESTFIKSAAGTTTAMQIIDPVDAAGTPISTVTNTDVTWSSSDENVTVDKDGVVTIGENFTTDGADTKTVTITGELNGIKKTCVITTYSYAYYEEMVEGATNFDGTFMTIAGKTAAVFPAGAAVNKYTMTAPVALDKTTTVVFNHVWSGSNTCGQKRELQFKNSEGVTIFSVYYNWTGLENGTGAIGSAVEKDKYTAVTAVIDPDAKTVTVSVDGKTDTLTCTLADDAKNIAGIEFNSASSVPAPDQRALGISSIKITQ